MKLVPIAGFVLLVFVLYSVRCKIDRSHDNIPSQILSIDSPKWIKGIDYDSNWFNHLRDTTIKECVLTAKFKNMTSDSLHVLVDRSRICTDRIDMHDSVRPGSALIDDRCSGYLALPPYQDSVLVVGVFLCNYENSMDSMTIYANVRYMARDSVIQVPLYFQN